MRKKILLRIILGIAAIVLLVMLLTKVVVEPWVSEKIQNSLNNNTSDYLLKIEKVHVLLFQSGVEIENITLIPKQGHEDQLNLIGEIETVKFKGVNLIKALFKKEIQIREAVIFNCRLNGKIEFPKKAKQIKVSPFNISIENLLIDNLFVDVKSTTTAQAYSATDGVLQLHEIYIEKQDTISPCNFGQIDFKATELKTVTADSLYAISAFDINYSSTSNSMTASSFVVHPNYPEYEFTSRNKFQTNRIDANLSGITFHNFSLADYAKSGNIISSYIEIGEMEMQVFKDKRKAFRHIERPIFQNMIYNYHGAMNIDSIGILTGNIVYTEHAEKAIEKGNVSFNEINAHIYKITNDTIYKTEKAFLILNAKALFMGKSKINLLLKARIFDSQNTFAVNGTLSGMEASELNPILEKSASITVTSGKINSLSFGFSANNTNATGNLKFLYQGLNFAIMNRQTGDTTAFIEQAKSLIANIIVLESNPMQGNEERLGIIEYERDPEKFVFGNFFRALLTGIKSSITKSQNKKKNS